MLFCIFSRVGNITDQKLMHNPESVPENLKREILWDFEIQTDPLISARRPDLVTVNKNKRTCRIEDSAASADRRLKLKVSKKRDKYLDLARELKKLQNMKVTVIPIVIGELGIVTKELIKELEDVEIRGRGESIQTTALLRSARIIRVLET